MMLIWRQEGEYPGRGVSLDLVEHGEMIQLSRVRDEGKLNAEPILTLLPHEARALAAVLTCMATEVEGRR